MTVLAEVVKILNDTQRPTQSCRVVREVLFEVMWGLEKAEEKHAAKLVNSLFDALGETYYK